MDSDDKPKGQILSRRDALKVLGVGGAAFFTWSTVPGLRNPLIPAAMASPALACVVRPELTIGTFFVDDQLNRSDIRFEPTDSSAKKGAPLMLAIGVFDVASKRCTPLEGAQVDVWHCDAWGVYSGVAERPYDTTGLIFLRGFQLTDAKGKVQFTTIYPGWYAGRTVHIHFMIRMTVAGGRRYEFVSQLFFNDALTDRVHKLKPYKRRSPRNTRNADDKIYSNGGRQLLLDVTGNATSGYIARINIGLDLTDMEVGAPDTFNQPVVGPPP
ncbi:MAG TPA: intradiol ring-cleavage dioxygenase [Anaerolineales bacterium]|nr:intradiol ring-cleavage dioxygenase [Anaerolineales bacterium]